MSSRERAEQVLRVLPPSSRGTKHFAGSLAHFADVSESQGCGNSYPAPHQFCMRVQVGEQGGQVVTPPVGF